MTIPTRFLNELRDRILISDIIAAKINLTKAGREFKGCCPFHNEKTASFYVNNEKQFYHCFGCGAHGDAINFLMNHDNVSFIEAVETLASQAGMEVPKQSPEDVKKYNEQKDLYALMDSATTFFEDELRKSANFDALNYLHNRGITEAILKQFRVGYTPMNDQALRKHLIACGFNDSQILAAGLIKKSNKPNKEPYAFFRDRIMFPVLDFKGRIIAFGGRALPEHLRPPSRSDFTPPKYVNSSDTELFHKGSVLYGESHARQALNEGQPIIVVEGYMDVIACVKEGFKGAVAPLGTSITEDQIFRIWNMYNDSERCPIFCFDGDNAGRRAAIRVIDRVLPLLKPNHSVSFVFLPEGEDPDSILRSRGKKAFQAILQNTIPLSEFIWIAHTSNSEFDTPEKRAGLSKTLDREVDRINDRTIQNYYRQCFKDKLRQKFGNIRTYNIKAPANTNRYKLGRPAFSQERLSILVLLATIMNHPEIFPEVEEDLGRLEIEDPNLNRLREKILSLLGEDSSLDIDDLNSHLIKAGFDSELSMVLSRSVRTHAGFIKKENSQDIVLEGWREITSFLNSKNMRKELLDASRELAENFCKEKEDKVLALHDVHNATDN